MRFSLIDRIISIEPGVKVTAVKTLSMSEEYLADHFPHFPVMPGVLMLEAMTQAAAWLVRDSEDFAHSIVVLKEACNVKYGQFARTWTDAPGHGRGRETRCGRNQAQSHRHGRGADYRQHRLTLQQYNLADLRPVHEWTDRSIIREMRNQFALLYQERAEVPAMSAG